MELDQLPEHLIILGGGYIGLEFGQMFRPFGSEVTIIQSAARLVMIEDDDVSDEVAAILRDDGITVRPRRRRSGLSRPTAACA
jgi:pyruvate/2-oxoglutarate dehydrogenase complex dihydrolipoamide dehydrogenase (E3) component